MIYYFLDLLINNLNIYTSVLVLIRLDNYNKFEMFLILLIDIFFNKVPIIFIILLCLKYLNVLLKRVFSRSFLVDNIIYIFNYLMFMMLVFVYRNNGIVFLDLIWFLINNFLVNYFCFLFLKKL